MSGAPALRLDGQLSFADATRAEHVTRATRVREALARAIDSIGKAETVAAAAGIDPSSLSKIVNGRGMNIPAELLAAVIALDHERVFAAAVADMAGADLVVRQRLTLEEENRELRSALTQAIEALQRVSTRT